MSKREMIFKAAVPIFLSLIVLILAGMPVTNAKPNLGPTNYDALHLNCQDCGTATPVFLANLGANSGNSNIIEIQARSTPVARYSNTGAFANSSITTLTVSGSTITPTRNIVPLTSTTAQTISSIVATNFPGNGELILYNTVATNTVVSETATIILAGNVTLGQYDSIRLVYDPALVAWVEISRSNN